MAEQRTEPMEYGENWDTGTYQTGPHKPSKSHTGWITVSLMCLIFVGGIASACGVTNARMLIRLIEQEQESFSLSENNNADNSGGVSFFRDENVQAAIDQKPDVLKQRLGIGASELKPLYRRYFGVTNGVGVSYVFDEECPLRVGDILIAVDDQPLIDVEQLAEKIHAAHSGDRMIFKIGRDDRVMEIDVTID